MIKSFADKATAALFSGRRVRSFPPDIHRRAHAKLQALDAADTLDFLRMPASNRLEQLRGDREGQWSIASMTNGASASAGKITTPMTSR